MGAPPPNQNSSEALNQRGVELAERGWLDEALREFGRAIELDQAAPFPLINRASVYLEQGRLLDALIDLLAAVRLAPNDAATRYSLGVFLSRHAGGLGIQELETALELEPDHIDTLLQLGATHAAHGEWTEAEAALDAALRIDPRDPLAQRERGLLALDLGDAHRGIEHFRAALDHPHAEPELLVDLGLAYLQAGFLDKSTQTLTEALARLPDHLLALYNLAAICAERGQAEGSLEWLRRALDLEPARVRDWLRDDAMFDRLRSDPRFEQLLAAQPPDVG
jgi:tetratricopeptide (TPR) repeat protein